MGLMYVKHGKVGQLSKHATLVDVDRPDSLLVRMQSALSKVDVVVTSGGVSMGEKVMKCMFCYHADKKCHCYYYYLTAFYVVI